MVSPMQHHDKKVWKGMSGVHISVGVAISLSILKCLSRSVLAMYKMLCIMLAH